MAELFPNIDPADEQAVLDAFALVQGIEPTAEAVRAFMTKYLRAIVGEAATLRVQRELNDAAREATAALSGDLAEPVPPTEPTSPGE